MNETPSEREDQMGTESLLDDPSPSRPTVHESHQYEPSMVSTESSFMPGQAAFSSTPATTRTAQNFENLSQASDESWTASMESPLVRLDRELQRFSTEDEDTLETASTPLPMPSLQIHEPTPNTKQHDRTVQPRSEKSKGKEAAQPLLRNVLRHNLHSMSDVSSSESILTKMSPLKPRGKPKTPIPKKYNPYLPPETDPANWNGVVDLTDPSVMTPPRFTRTKPSARRNPATPAKESDEEDSFDGLPPGMSPPVLMSPARPPRSSAELGLLGQTPTRLATARITRDLVRDIQYKSGGDARHLHGYANSRIESTVSTILTPPSLSKYNRQDTTESIAMGSSFESLMQRVGPPVPPSTAAGSTPGLRLRSKAGAEVSSHPNLIQPPGPVEALVDFPEEPLTPVYSHGHDIDSDSDSYSFDEVNNTAHPSDAFMMASAQPSNDSDDSFDSNGNSRDSLTAEDVNLVEPFFTMGVEDDGFDDSFDDDLYDGNVMGETEEETLFGVPPAQRIHAQAQMRAGGHLGDGLHILGEDLNTVDIGARARSGRVEESPTPWGAGRG